jgi:hypothetical protein
MPESIMREPDMEMNKAFVLEVIQRVVKEGLAAWNRNADDAVELRLVTGERFILGDTGITQV